MSGGNITTVVDNLEARGLVRRERRGDDRRQVTVHLTPEGRRLITKVFPNHVRAIVDAFSALTPSEQETLGRLAKKLGLSQPGNA
jgi:MarR family transcriptional regulator, 2-MHQ and catechol-resistance regulon repressor